MAEPIKTMMALASLAIKREDEEASNKRRLMYDGHGIGEDKRLVNIIKNISKLYLVEHSEDKFHELVSIIIRDINTAITQTDRQLKISAICDKEMANNIVAKNHLIQQIEHTKGELLRLHLERDFVDKLKKISIYPDCQTTEQEIYRFEQINKKHRARVQVLRDHIVIVIHSCRNLRRVLEDDISDDGFKMEIDTSSWTPAMTEQVDRFMSSNNQQT